MFNVTLTFDNGPEPDVTPGVLRTLQATGVCSTFFVLGEKMIEPGRRALAERAALEGHWIGNHTFSHTAPLGLEPDPDAPEVEIGRTQSLIGDLAHPLKLFRPTGIDGTIGPHLLSRTALGYLKARSFSCVLWNCVPRDWLEPVGWVEQAVQSCRTQPWTVVVVHDLPTGAMDHLDRFIGRIHDLGGCFRQDFPDDCMPLRAGEEIRSMAPYLADA